MNRGTGKSGAIFNGRGFIGPLGMELSRGNRKIGPDTLTLNMGSAIDCPAFKKGLCRVHKQFGHHPRFCFSRAAEDHNPGVLPRRRRQEIYWKSTPVTTMIEDLDSIFSLFNGSRASLQYFRFNEAGDFWDQDSAEKASELASYLNRLGFTVYVNTARSDLNFKNIKFLVRGSGWEGPNSETRVIGKTAEVPPKFHLCPMDCRVCRLCKVEFSNIAYRFHVGGRPSISKGLKKNQ